MKMFINIIKFLILLLLPLLLFLINDVLAVFSMLLLWGYLAFWVLRGIWRFILGIITSDEQKENASAEKSTSPKEDTKTIKELHEEIKQEAKDAYDNADKENSRDLKLFNLLSESALEFGEVIKLIQTSKHSLVRLLTVYMFLEQLSPNFQNTTSSLGKFLYRFAKQELSPEEWEINLLGNSDDDLDLEDPDSPFVALLWNDMLEDRISTSLKQCPDQEMKSTMCASFCAELVLEIEDDDLINRFTSLARTVLKEEDLFSPSTETTLISIEF
tara:strand:- start:566 stop:1381 length:816 start_codon:yes stop_codon:yes gene_type:complete